MSVDRSYSLNVTATIKDYEKKLAEVPGVTEKEARKAALKLHNELLKGQKLANAAAKKAASDAANAWSEASKEALQAAGDASKARGALGLFSAGGSEAAGVLNDLADAGEGLSGVMGALPALANPAGLAIAGVGAAVAAGLAYWKLSNQEQELAAKRAKEVKAASDELKPVLDGIAETELKIAVATGRMTEAQAAEVRIRKEGLALMKSSTAGVQERQAELREELSSTTTALVDMARATSTQMGVFGLATRGVLAFARGTEEVNSDLAFQQTLIVDATHAVEQHTDAQLVLHRTEEKVKAGKESTTKATKGLTEAEREAARVAADLTRAREAQAAASAFGARLVAIESAEKEAQRIVADSAGKELSVVEQLEAKKTDALLRYQEKAKAAAFDSQQIAADSAAIEIGYAEQIAAAKARLHAEEAERVRQSTMSQVGAYADMLGSVASIASTISDSMAEKNKKAALVAFRISQGAAIAQAAINTALAISNALATPGVPPPVAAAFAVAAGLAGGAQVAAIAAQKPPTLAHTGETFVKPDRPGAGEVDRRVRVGEAIIPSQGADLIGRDRIERARRGQDPYADQGGGNFTVYGHRAFGRFMRDVVDLPNPLRAAMVSGSGRSVGVRPRKKVA